MTALLFLRPEPMLFVETPGHVNHLSPAFTFTNKWILLLWAPLLPIHCIQTQSLCLYAAEGLVTALHSTGAEHHWLQLACRLTGIHLGNLVLRGTKKILSLLQCCVRSVTSTTSPKSSLYHSVVCIASDRLGNMWLVTTELPFHTPSLHYCLRVMPMPCIAAGLNQQ